MRSVSALQQNENLSLYVAFDKKTRHSVQCGCVTEHKSCDGIKRPAALHTLINGTIDIIFVDLICQKCKSIVMFDGRDSAMFSAGKKAVYYRDLLDYCL